MFGFGSTAVWVLSSHVLVWTSLVSETCLALLAWVVALVHCQS